MTRNRRFAAALGLAVIAATAVTTPAAAQVTAKQVSTAIAAEFGVRVLKIRKSRLDGAPVFLVTVMNPGGDFNEAFQITTMAVDVKTGKLVSGFRHLSSGLRGNQAPSYQTSQ